MNVAGIQANPCTCLISFVFVVYSHHKHPKYTYEGNLTTDIASVIAELLRAEVARAEPHTLENLVTHQCQKFWLPRDCPYVRTSVRQFPYHNNNNFIKQSVIVTKDGLPRK